MVDNLSVRHGYIQLCMQRDYNIMITLATNMPLNLSQMTERVSSFFGRLDRKYLGHTFNTLPPNKRADGIVFIEKLDSNTHAHALVTLPYGDDDTLRDETRKLWERLCRSGSIDLKNIYAIEGAADYCTKEMRSQSFSTEQIVLLRQFMSNKSLDSGTN